MGLAMTQRNAQFLEICLGQLVHDAEIDVVLAKNRCVAFQLDFA